MSSPIHSLHTPTVFISYSHDNKEHKKWIEELANNLSKAGVSVIVDCKSLNVGDNFIHFMDSSIKEADKVIVVFTPNYKLKAEGRVGGVGYEYSVITVDLYDKISTNKKYLPILKEGGFQESVPSFMQQFFALDFRDPLEYNDRFDALLLALFNKPQLGNPTIENMFLTKEIPHESKAIKIEGNNVIAIKEIQLQTMYLWRELKNLNSESTSLTIDIKKATFLKIKNSLNLLRSGGHLDYKTEDGYVTINTKIPVLMISVWNISRQLKNCIRLIEHGEEVNF